VPCATAPAKVTYRKLYASPVVRVSDYTCLAGREGPQAEELCGANNVVLMRRGAFSKHFGRRTVTADVNQAAFFSKGSAYRVAHPAECGDRGTVFELSPRVLSDIVRELDSSAEGRPDRPFPFDAGPCETAVFWRHRDLVLTLEAADAAPLEPLWADVTAIQLVADVLEDAFERHGVTRKPRRRGTDEDHAERVEAAKAHLASRLSERITLEGVAEAAQISPFHLARLFRRHTGVPVHRYLTRLRLRASLERLAEGTPDLTELALDLGFSSHGHFTDTFRREFGRTPSEVRRHASRKALREMGKNLEV